MKKILAFALCLSLLMILTGCSFDTSYDRGHAEGREEGREEGYEYGYDEGYDQGYEDAVEELQAPDALDVEAENLFIQICRDSENLKCEVFDSTYYSANKCIEIYVYTEYIFDYELIDIGEDNLIVPTKAEWDTFVDEMEKISKEATDYLAESTPSASLLIIVDNIAGSALIILNGEVLFDISEYVSLA